MSGTPWAEEEKDILKKLTENGYSTKEIMPVLNRGYYSIREMKRVMGLSNVSYYKPNINYELLKQMLGERKVVEL